MQELSFVSFQRLIMKSSGQSYINKRPTKGKEKHRPGKEDWWEGLRREIMMAEGDDVTWSECNFIQTYHINNKLFDVPKKVLSLEPGKGGLSHFPQNC